MRRNNFHSHELKRIASALEKLVEMLEKGKKRRQLRKRRVNAPSIPVRNEATDSGKVNNGVSGQVKRRANLSFEDLIRRSGIKVVRPLCQICQNIKALGYLKDYEYLKSPKRYLHVKPVLEASVRAFLDSK